MTDPFDTVQEALDVLIARAGHSPDPLRHSDKAERDARSALAEIKERLEAWESHFAEFKDAREARSTIVSLAEDLDAAERERNELREALREIREMCRQGHGDDLIATRADAALAIARVKRPQNSEGGHAMTDPFDTVLFGLKGYPQPDAETALAEIKERLEAAEQVANEWELIAVQMQTRAEAAERERDELRVALHFYADGKNYVAMSLMLRRHPEDEHPPVATDCGAIARAALAIGEDKPQCTCGTGPMLTIGPHAKWCALWFDPATSEVKP